ncbi:molybdopterin molybdotransferase MoeA [Dermatobacter hominis]|uniref:molybdopterin molybdotransferase MoeA n=1 Tax=Dermatobacter hominis TaxID=2884263 RepID=UPI001D12EDFA|nr:gephyrin-like molybdotransferase Glp [Dermatobacter hominis]UDY37871.1 molybdopterin molybdotransferase MoeA [Dermatobacter hominis]
MIPLQEALDHVLSRVPAQPAAAVELADALGLVTVDDVVATELVPGWDNTALDGYAVRAEDVATPDAELDVVATVAAGDAGDQPIGPGQAVRIMTGAPVPPGADAIAMVERTRSLDDGRRVQVEGTIAEGTGIRRAGDDVRPGDVVVPAGTVLRVAHLGVLASIGVGTVDVRRRTRVGVLSTGDELVEDGAPLARGQVRDSNRLALLALCRSSGFEAVDLGLVRDDEAAIEATIRRGVANCDALLTSGGVSMGDFDYVKAVLGRIGDMRWMQIAIKPAKPFAFGLVDGVPVFGLPGNPVSSLVSFELLARPGLLHGAGRTDLHRRTVRAAAAEDLRRRPDGKIHFVRVSVRQDEDLGFTVASAGGQGSHQMTAMAAADGLAVLPDGDGVAAGDPVDVILLHD